MSADLKKLYSEVIRSHNEHPYHFEKADALTTLRAYNPICGDRFDLYVESENQQIKNLHFNGFGCAISKASTSILLKSIEGKTFQEALEVCDKFLKFIRRELNYETILSEEFTAFSGVHDFPERYSCVTLSWEVMKEYLTDKI